MPDKYGKTPTKRNFTFTKKEEKKIRIQKKF